MKQTLEKDDFEVLMTVPVKKWDFITKKIDERIEWNEKRAQKGRELDLHKEIQAKLAAVIASQKEQVKELEAELKAVRNESHN